MNMCTLVPRQADHLSNRADEYIVVDWQVSYDFENGLVGVQVNNLTDEANIGHYGNQMLNGESQSSAVRCICGVNFKF